MSQPVKVYHHLTAAEKAARRAEARAHHMAAMAKVARERAERKEVEMVRRRGRWHGLWWCGTLVWNERSPIKMGDGACLAGIECFRAGQKRPLKRVWCAQRELYVNPHGTVFAKMTMGERVLFVDCITGSLYEDGCCLSNRVLLSYEMLPAQALGVSILLNKKSTEIDV